MLLQSMTIILLTLLYWRKLLNKPKVLQTLVS